MMSFGVEVPVEAVISQLEFMQKAQCFLPEQSAKSRPLISSIATMIHMVITILVVWLSKEKNCFGKSIIMIETGNLDQTIQATHPKHTAS